MVSSTVCVTLVAMAMVMVALAGPTRKEKLADVENYLRNKLSCDFMDQAREASFIEAQECMQFCSYH